MTATRTRPTTRQVLGTADLKEFLLRRCGLSPNVADGLLATKFLGVTDNPSHSHWHSQGGHVPCDFACFVADEFGYGGEIMGGAVEALGLAMEATLLDLATGLTTEMGLSAQEPPRWTVPNPFQHTLVTELDVPDSRDRTPISVRACILPPLTEFARTIYPMEMSFEWQERLPEALASIYVHLAQNSYQGFEPKMGKNGERSMHFAKTFSKPGHVTRAENKTTGDSVVGVTIDFSWTVAQW